MRLFFWALLLSCTAAAHAARFDERVKAPRAANAADFKRSVRDYFAAYEQREKSAEEKDVLVRDAKAYDRWIDIEWMLDRGLDDGSMGDLSEFGMQRADDGSYTVRVKEHPQWMPIDVSLMALRVPSVYDAYAPELKVRGFRDQDLAVLKNYLDSNNWERDAYVANRSLTESFALRAQVRQRSNLTINRDETRAYMYQHNRNSLQVRRAWAVGLLDALDQQRQRILISYLKEFDTTRTYGAPQSNRAEKLERVVAPLLSGQYVQDLNQQELRTRQ